MKNSKSGQRGSLVYWGYFWQAAFSNQDGERTQTMLSEELVKTFGASNLETKNLTGSYMGGKSFL